MANRYRVYLKETYIKTEIVTIYGDNYDEVRQKAEDKYGENKEFGVGCARHVDVGSIEIEEEDV